MRLPFLRSKKPPTPDRLPPGDDAPGGVLAARTRARRRLVGALVLLVVGVLSFPVLFETQPRPLGRDASFQAGPREVVLAAQGASTAPPAPSLQPEPVPALPSAAPAASEAPGKPPEIDPARAVEPEPRPAPQPPASAPTVAATPAPPTPATAPAPTAAPTPVPKPAAPALDDGRRARALLEGQPSTATAVAGSGRFVVQVGAFTEPKALRETRQKVEGLGFKTYTQVIENESGKRTRVRLGPFDSRAEAEAAAAKVKTRGLPANVLVL